MTAYDTLTQDDKKIIQLISYGYKNREIADELGIPFERVGWMVRKLCIQFGTNRKSKLAAMIAARMNADNQEQYSYSRC